MTIFDWDDPVVVSALTVMTDWETSFVIIPPAFAINSVLASIKQDDLGLHLIELNVGWSVSQGNVRMNVKKGG